MVEFVVKQEGDRRVLIVNCKGLPYGPDVAQFPEAMRTVVDILKTVEASEVVLSEIYERIYNEEQTKMLKSIADAITRFEAEAVWSPSHLGAATTDSKVIAARHEAVAGIVNAIYVDPFGAYMNLLKLFKAEDERSKVLKGADAEDSRIYRSTLNFMREILEASSMIQRVKGYLAQLGSIPTGRGMYVTLFETAIKPSFIGSRIFFGATEKLELIDQYSVLGTQVYIYKHPDQVQPLYYINPPEYTLPPEKYFLLEKTKEVVAGRRPESVGFMDMAQARKYFYKIYIGIISDLAAKNRISLTVEEKEDLATIVTRYTIGYGILEIILSDRQITDAYLDSPLGVKPIYIVHSKYGQCQTNVIFSDEEARAVVSRFRALSGRPFDEAHPILDFDLTDLQTRVCVIGKPLATDGIAFAFRLHKTTPWTLAQFLDVKMMNPLCAGMLSMFVDAQASMLIVGSRGSGKTSFLQAMMLEIPQSLRIIVQEDTLELPIPYMKGIGYNIQRLKTRPPLGGGTEAEPAAEDALRTALRLGDSVLIVGEVRSTEAKALYEAMRVGAVGNVVMGTIHGESAYSIWDRVVNDLGVPTTSFKATDFCVVTAPIRFKGALKRERRVIGITEVKKHWEHDPQAEGGFLEWMQFDAAKDNLDVFMDNLKESEWLERVRRVRGLTFDDIWADVNARAAAKQYLVEQKRKYDIPKLLESDYTVRSHNKFILMADAMRAQHGSLDHSELLVEWKKWLDDTLVRELVAAKRL
jgi:type IV secretory pathway ATPase VirB11/archaellum biosynthesis ATPase